jgi:hypothetical protein
MEIMGKKRGGFFLDLAAHDAQHLSNTYSLEVMFDWTGLCIEVGGAARARRARRARTQQRRLKRQPRPRLRGNTHASTLRRQLRPHSGHKPPPPPPTPPPPHPPGQLLQLPVGPRAPPLHRGHGGGVEGDQRAAALRLLAVRRGARLWPFASCGAPPAPRPSARSRHRVPPLAWAPPAHTSRLPPPPRPPLPGASSAASSTASATTRTSQRAATRRARSCGQRSSWATCWSASTRPASSTTSGGRRVVGVGSWGVAAGQLAGGRLGRLHRALLLGARLGRALNARLAPAAPSSPLPSFDVEGVEHQIMDGFPWDKYT